MTSIELHTLILVKMKELRPDITLSSLYKAILLESCENTTLLEQAKDFNEDEMIVTAMNLFEIATASLKGVIAGAVKAGGDKVVITYRGETHTFDKNSPIVVNALKD